MIFTGCLAPALTTRYLGPAPLGGRGLVAKLRLMAGIAWRDWSQAAFEEAKAEDRPILLSISAVWCHWCHVMDRTTYSDARVAEEINGNWLPIRVDNDVRPDVNARYNMGGWPTTAFLTPRGDLLTGATYLPPDDMLSALRQVATVYRTQGSEVAARVLEMRKRSGLLIAAQAGSLRPELVETVLSAVENAYDADYGGFGGAPKFPQGEALLLLTEQAALRERGELLEMARFTLQQMAGGGTYDQVAGGFFRYSTTQDWSVPHFEKMLEDHGLLIAALARSGQAEILDRTAAYLDVVLRHPQTGLYAGSQDADERYYALDAAGRADLEPPYIDRRVFSAWNCMLAIAYLDADARLGRPQLRDEAANVLRRLFADYRESGGGLLHADGVPGQLGDQAWGLLAAARAYSAGLGQEWLAAARELASHLDARYGDARFGGYFDHAGGDTLGRLEEPVKPLGENATVALALFELETLLGDPEAGYRRQAERTLESVAELPGRYGLLAAAFARAYDRLLKPAVKVTTSNAALARAALAAYPYAVIEPGDQRAIVCVGTVCLAPLEDPEKVGAAVHDAAFSRA